MAHRLHLKSVQTKLLVSFLALTFSAMALVTALAYQRSSAALAAAAGTTLESEATRALETIDRNLDNRVRDLKATVRRNAARGAPEVVTAAANDLVRTYGFYDLIVVADVDGNVIATNTVDAEGRPLRAQFTNRNVKGETWFQAVVGGSLARDQIYTSDVVNDPWVAEIANGEGQVLNMAGAVRDESGAVIRAWSNRLAFDRLGRAVMDDTRKDLAQRGMKTVETQLLSKAGLVLDDADPAAEMKLNLVDVGLAAAKAGTEGKSGYVTEVHKRTGKLQVNGYAAEKGWAQYPGLGWSALVRQDVSEAAVAATGIRNYMILIALAALAVVVVAAVVIARGIARPLVATADVLESLADGELRRHVAVESADEVGRMGTALNRAMDSMRDALGGIAGAATGLASSSEELTSVSRQMTSSAEETASQAGVVSAAAEQVNGNIGSVAASVEEMTACVREIAKNAQEAARVASQAVDIAQGTSTTIHKLGDSSNEIGNVLKVITSIAEQTNLLALNATIEAARAGESGKGFAVVANEVKELAKETAKATEDIGRKIEAIQDDTRGAIQAITEITEVIHQINVISTTIAGAVEEQSATTNEIARNVSEAARGSVEITRNITSVAQSAGDTTAGATQTQLAASELAQMASDLTQLLSRFQWQGSGNTMGLPSVAAHSVAPLQPAAPPPRTNPSSGASNGNGHAHAGSYVFHA